jgi:hypothetical protein
MEHRVINLRRKNPAHFPCLALRGTMTNDVHLKGLMDFLMKTHAPSADEHHPLRRTWAIHSNSLDSMIVGEHLGYDKIRNDHDDEIV